ncbi:MAG: hypothetical protein HYS89_00440 [Candidatus Colwellbacteria bacterium]|nr:hypothetical protein [Candidatus Colwellbacteria bacterium]
MVTFFTTPKPFRGHNEITQKNALKSWTLLEPKCEIILFGNEEGTAEAAAQFGARHIPTIKTNEHGMPYVNDLFRVAEEQSSRPTLVFINTDIILLDDLLPALVSLKEPRYLMVGRRIDMDITTPLDFSPGWEKTLRDRVKREGAMHGYSGIDYFAFPKKFWQDIPPFVVARTSYDNWFLFNAWERKLPLIDATAVVTTIHQNHDYNTHPKGAQWVWKGPEAQRNLALAGGVGHLFTIRDAGYILTAEGLKKPPLTFYRLLTIPFRYYERSFLLKPLLFLGWAPFILWRKIRQRV